MKHDFNIPPTQIHNKRNSLQSEKAKLKEMTHESNYEFIIQLDIMCRLFIYLLLLLLLI